MTSNTQAKTYSVREIDPSPKEWNTLIQDAPGGGHVFQSHAWGEFKKKLGWTPVKIVMERDGETVGAGQFLLYNTAPVPGKLMYAPKGPWLPWEDEEAVRTFFKEVGSIAAEKGVHTIKVEPEVLEEQEGTKKVLRELGFEKFRWDLNFKTTMVLDLAPSEEDLMASMKKDTRYGVRRASREGIEVVEDNSEAGIEDFWKMFEVTAERNGFWYRPHEYQVPMWRAMIEARQARLFFADHEGDRLAGMFLSNLGGKCWYSYGASTNEKRNLNPTYLLQWEAMRWAKERGITYYDMVSIPSPDELHKEHPLYGAYKFKAGFGGEIRDFLGCLDLPIKPAQAKLWNRLEPWYYRAYRKIKKDIYY